MVSVVVCLLVEESGKLAMKVSGIEALNIAAVRRMGTYRVVTNIVG